MITLRTATVPPELVAEHCHADDAHFVLALDAGYITAARGAPDISDRPMLVFNPLGCVHRDRFAELGGHFLSVCLNAEALETFAVDMRLPAEPILATSWLALLAAQRLIGQCVRGAERFASECAVVELLGATAVERAPAAEPAAIRKAIEFMRAARGAITVGEVAAATGLHPVYLARGFRKAFGCSPSNYLLALRIAHASALLRKGRQELAAVADAAGFSDQSHMTRAFQSAYRATPSIYSAAFR